VSGRLLAIEWLTPLAGLALAGALLPPLLLLYFLRLRRRAAKVPTTFLWRRSVEDMQANVPFQRLRPSVLLLLQVLLVALVALALMQPRMDLGRAGGGRTVIAVDVSASMGATDLGPGRTRLQVAKEQAAERVDRIFGGGLFAPDPGEAMVVAFSDGARILQPFTRSRADLLRAIEAIEQTDGGSRIGDALALARAFAPAAGTEAPGAPAERPLSVELWSDGRIADLAEQALRPGETVTYHVVGRADSGDMGVESIAADRSVKDPGLVQVFATVRNDARVPAETDLELLLDGQVRAVTPRPLQVPAASGPEPGAPAGADGAVYRSGTERVTFPPVLLPRAGVLEVRLTRRDALAADDVARVAVAAPRRLRIALVGAVDDFTATAVRLLPSEKVERLSSADFAARTAKGEAFDVVVAPAAALPSPLPAGRYLALGVPAGVAGLNPYGTKTALAVRSVKPSHPLLRAVNLDDLHVRSATATAPASDVDAVVEGPDVPLVMVARRGPVAAVVVAFDPLQSDWPYQRGFVTFVANAVEWLGTLDQAAVQESHRPGDSISVRVPEGVAAVEVSGPDGIRAEASVRDSVATFGPVQRAGAYRFRWTDARGEQVRVAAVNPAEGEGVVSAAQEISLGSATVQGVAGGGASLSDLWPWALGAAILLLLAEWWEYHRRHWLRRPAPRAGPGGDGARRGREVARPGAQPFL
jgi:hypothetical protein